MISILTDRKSLFAPLLVLSAARVTNGGVTAITYSNTITVDATHQFTGSGAGLTSIPMTGLVQPGAILTNGGSVAVTYSNNLTVDAAHFVAGPASHSTITNTGLTGAKVVGTDANGKMITATDGSGLSSVTAGTLSVGATINTASTVNLTNAIKSSAVDYAIQTSDTVILMTAASKKATLPTAVGCPGKIYTIKLTASGTNAIVTTSSQKIDNYTLGGGGAGWTNTAINKYVTVISDNANWWVIANN
jgi:hypothetical protein